MLEIAIVLTANRFRSALVTAELALALILLIVSFFAKIPGGVLWAGLVLVTVVVQVLLGMFGEGAPALGLVHG